MVHTTNHSFVDAVTVSTLIDDGSVMVSTVLLQCPEVAKDALNAHSLYSMVPALALFACRPALHADCPAHCKHVALFLGKILTYKFLNKHFSNRKVTGNRTCHSDQPSLRARAVQRRLKEGQLWQASMTACKRTPWRRGRIMAVCSWSSVKGPACNKNGMLDVQA